MSTELARILRSDDTRRAEILSHLPEGLSSIRLSRIVGATDSYVSQLKKARPSYERAAQLATVLTNWPGFNAPVNGNGNGPRPSPTVQVTAGHVTPFLTAVQRLPNGRLAVRLEVDGDIASSAAAVADAINTQIHAQKA